jgi:DNA-binding GntR family transcriptional regulator
MWVRSKKGVVRKSGRKRSTIPRDLAQERLGEPIERAGGELRIAAEPPFGYCIQSMTVHPARSATAAVTPRFEPLARRTVAGAVVDAIRERILGGGYPSGTQLRQEMLAAELGVSRIPVREALRQLEAEGLVTFAPHKGAVVSAFSVGEIDELFELRATLEADLVRRAVPRLTNEQLETAAQVLALFEAALSAGDVGAWGELNWRFHSTLYAPAARPVTLATVERLHRLAERYMRMQLALTHGESRAATEHRAILERCRTRDARGASSLLWAHIREAGRALVGFLRDRERADGLIHNDEQT